MSTDSRARPLKFAVLAGFIVVAALIALVFVALTPWKPGYRFLAQGELLDDGRMQIPNAHGGQDVAEFAVFRLNRTVDEVVQGARDEFGASNMKHLSNTTGDMTTWAVGDETFIVRYVLHTGRVQVAVTRVRPINLLDWVREKLKRERHG